MSKLEEIKIVTKYELLKQFRRKRFLGALIFIILAQFLTIGLYRGLDVPAALPIVSDAPELFAIFTTGISTLAVLAAVFFAGDAIVSEFEHGTGNILFPNPVKRSNIVLGKYLACLIATLMILVVGYAISEAALIVFYQEIPTGVLGCFVLVFALASGIIGITFFFSSLLKGGMGATIATLVFYMVVDPLIGGSLSYAGHEPWFLISYAGHAVTAVYGIEFMNPGGMIPGGGGGMMFMSPDPTLSFFVLILYALVGLLVSIWLTKRREMS